MTVAITSLGEHLLAELARVGSLASMRTDMVQYVAQFAESLAAGEALETLIFATGLLVDHVRLPEAFLHRRWRILRLFDSSCGI